jgi:tartrate dehydrogenase/decarboxylase/D-malate dehydrogenase
MMAKHKIALIPGDGIGKEVLPEGVKVLEAAARRFNFELEFTDFDWSCDRLVKTGKMMPDDGMETLKGFESIFLGAVGWPGVPDHVSLWGLLIPIRRDFDEYVNLRPVRLFEGVPSPLANRKPGEIDFWVVRENTEGEYSSIGGRMFQGTDDEMAIQQSIFTRKGVDRILKFAFDFASTTKKKHVTSATKSNGIIHTMPFWDERFEVMRKKYPDIKARPVPHRHPDGAFRAQPGLVRRGGRLQPVRRHPVRPRPGAHRLDRRGAVGQHQPGAQVSLDVRAGSRLGA